MVEFTTLGVLKRGKGSFCPKIKSRAPERVKQSEESSKNEEAASVPGSCESEFATNIQTSNIDNPDHLKVESFRREDNQDSDSSLKSGSCYSATIRDKCVSSYEHGTIPVVTPTAVPSIISTTSLISTPSASVNKNQEPTSSNNKVNTSAKELSLGISEGAISSVSLETLIKHRFKHGSVSKAERTRLQSSMEIKKSLKNKSPNQSAPKYPNNESQDRNPSSEKKTAVPQLIMVNGRIKLDYSSLLVKRQEADMDLEEVNEGSQRFVTSSSFLSEKHKKKVKWTAELTGKFYEGLSYFGTNFNLISMLFDDIDRRQIKAKFSVEEKTNGWKITAALKRRKPIGEVALILKERFISKSNSVHEWNDTTDKHHKKDAEVLTDSERMESEEQPEVDVKVKVPSPTLTPNNYQNYIDMLPPMKYEPMKKYTNLSFAPRAKARKPKRPDDDTVGFHGHDITPEKKFLHEDKDIKDTDIPKIPENSSAMLIDIPKVRDCIQN